LRFATNAEGNSRETAKRYQSVLGAMTISAFIANQNITENVMANKKKKENVLKPGMYTATLDKVKKTRDGWKVETKIEGIIIRFRIKK
jgi:hypothetical protein